jgi:hypothetical protein
MVKDLNNSWCKSGFFEKIYAALIVKHKKFIKLKIMNTDGTHTPAKKGGEEVAYQGRQKCKTTNLLIISDSNGCPLVCSHAISGNHNDLFNIKEHASKMLTKLSGLFTNLNNTLNADT